MVKQVRTAANRVAGRFIIAVTFADLIPGFAVKCVHVPNLLVANGARVQKPAALRQATVQTLSNCFVNPDRWHAGQRIVRYLRSCVRIIHIIRKVRVVLLHCDQAVRCDADAAAIALQLKMLQGRECNKNAWRKCADGVAVQRELP